MQAPDLRVEARSRPQDAKYEVLVASKGASTQIQDIYPKPCLRFFVYKPQYSHLRVLSTLKVQPAATEQAAEKVLFSIHRSANTDSYSTEAVFRLPRS